MRNLRGFRVGLTLLAFVFTVTAFAQTTIFTDGFEGAFPGSWTVGNDGGITTAKWGDNSAKFSAGSFSAFCADNGSNTRTVYDNNLKTYMERRGVSLSGYVTATLTFKYWLNSESGFDFFTVNVRDQAGSWHELMKDSGNDSSAGWQSKSLNLNAYAGQTGLYVQFRFDSDGATINTSPSGVWVDEVSLTATIEYGDPPASVSTGTTASTWIWPNQNGDFSGSYSISGGTEVDVYAFMPDQTGSYVITTAGSLDSQLRIYNSSGTAITTIIDSTGSGETTTQSFTSGQWYYIAVAGFQLNTGNYTLSVNGPNLPRASISISAGSFTGSAADSVNYGGDLDYFQITAPSGTTTLNLTVTPAAGLDPFPEVYDSSGTRLTTFDSGGSGSTDTLASFTITAGATYYVGVSANGRNQTGSYTLSVDFNPDNYGDPSPSVTPGTGTWVWVNQNGDFSGSYNISSGTEVDVYAFKADQTGNYVITTGGTLDSQLRIYNSSGTAITTVIDTGGGETTTESLVAGNWFYIAVAGYQLDTGNYTLSINGPNLPRPSIPTPGPDFTGTATGYSLESGGDLDYFQITAPSAATTLYLVVTPETGLNTFCELYDSSGNYLTYFDDGGTSAADLLLNYGITAGATYYIGVSGKLRTSVGNYTVRVDFDPDKPSVQTLLATSVGTTSATLNGRVTADGGSPILERIFEWTKASGDWGTGTRGIDYDYFSDATTTFTYSGNDFSLSRGGFASNTQYKYRVWARNSAGSSDPLQVNSVTFITTAPPAPTISSVTPSNGSTAGGNIVTIDGTNLEGASSVTFGGTEATTISYNITTGKLEPTVPAHAAGVVSITVTTPGGSVTKINGYTYGSPVSVSNVSPNGGQIFTDGDTISIGWTLSDPTAAVSAIKLEYSTDSGGNYNHVIRDDINPAGVSYQWTPNCLFTSLVRVRVSALNSQGGVLASASSANNFTLTIPIANPVAEFAAPYQVLPGTIVSFSAAASRPGHACFPIKSYEWTFRNNSGYTLQTTGRDVTFQFGSSDSYTVELRVGDNDSRNNDGLKSVLVFVDNHAAGASSTGIDTSHDPVNLANGNYISEHIDLQIPGKGFPFEFKRFYNSKFRNETGVPMGYGWTHSYNISLLTSGTNVFITFGDGHVETHFDAGGGNYVPEPNSGIYDRLTKNGDNSWTLLSKDQMRYNFDPSGRFNSIADRNDYTLTLTYNGAQLSVITNSAGRVITFTPAANGCLGAMTDSIGRTIRFEYDTETNLVRVINAKNGTNSYAYTNFHQLTEGRDPRGIIYVSNVYDTDQRVVSYQSDANGAPTGFFYDFANHVTRVTNAFNKIAVHRFDDRLLVTNIIDEAGYSQSFGYDANRNRIFVVDKNGNPTSFAHDERGNITNKVDALNKVTSIEYNLMNDPTRRVDALNNSITFGYDARGNLTTTTNALGHVSRIQYMNGLPFMLTDARGFSTTNHFDEWGDLAVVVNPLGQTNVFEFDSVGRKIREINPLGQTNEVHPDNNNNIDYSVDALGYTNWFTFDENDNRLSSLAPNGALATNLYDIKDLPVFTRDSEGGTTSNRFDLLDRLIRNIDPLNHPTDFGFDDVGNTIAITNALNQVTRFGYDPNGNQIAVTNATGKVTRKTVDALNRVTSISDPSGTTFFGYDALSRRTAITNANNQVTLFRWDAIGRLTNVVDSGINNVFFTYDENGNRLTSTDPKGQTSTNVFDALNRVVAFFDGRGFSNQFTFDPVGNLVFKTNANNQVIAYLYDARRQLTNVAYPNGSNVSFQYDAVGNRTNMVDSQGTTSWQFDRLRRLNSVTDPYGMTVSFGYDIAGNRVSITYPGNKTVFYGFDALNRLESVTNWLNGVIRQTYTEVGNLSAITNANGTTVAFGYDDSSRLLTVTNARADNSIIAAYSLVLDSLGNHRQSASIQPLVPFFPNQTNIYTHDPDNRLTSVDGLPVTHDNNGNLTGIGTDNYTFDFENRLTHFAQTNITGDCIYDGLGNRLAYSTNGMTRRFVLDRAASLTQVLMETDTNGAPIAYYVYAAGLAQRITPDGAVSTYHFDARGSTVALTDSDGNISDSYAYDSFGVVVNVDGDSPQPFLYLGQYGIMNDGSGFCYARARFFSPQLGRFISKDPLTGTDTDPQSWNQYAYALNNPYLFADVTGLSPQEGGGGWWSRFWQAQGGYWKAIVVDPVTGALYVAQHPIQAAEGLGNAILHPIDTGGAIINGFVGDITSDDLSRQGSAIGGVVSVLIPGSAIKGAKVAEEASVLAKTATVLEQGTTAALKGGYYEVNGLKFSKYYYEKLWSTGRRAPSLVANEILSTGAKGVPDKMAGFLRYETAGWVMVYNPTTKEVYHLQPLK